MASVANLDLVISLKDQASKGLGGISKSVGALGVAVGTFAGGAALAGVHALTSAVSDFVSVGVEGFKASALAVAQTEAVIKSTGGAAGVTTQQVSDLATAFSLASGKSLFGDDVIQQAENMTLTFTNISKEVFPEVIQTSLDMATALHSTPEAMAQMTGKALSSVAGITALRRVGVQFTDDQVKLAKQMFETGDMIGYQRLVLGELSKEFGGSAEAAAKADGGIGQFKDTMGEVAESIVTKAMPMVKQFFGLLTSPGFLAGVQTLADGLISGLGTAMTWLSDTAIPALTAGWQAIQKPLAIARDAVLTFVKALQGDWVNDSGILPFHAIIGEVGLALREFGGWIVTIGQQIAGGDWAGAFATLTSGLTSFGATLGATLLGWGQQLVDWIAPMIPPALAALGAFVTSIGTWVVEQVPVIGAQLLAWGTAFVNWVAPMIPPALAALGTLITSIGAWVVEQVPILISQLIAWGTAFVEWVAPMIPPAIAALSGLASGVIGWIGEQAAPILAKLSAWATAFIAWIPGATVTFLQQWPGFLSSFLDWIGTAAGPLLLKLGEWALQFVAWIVPMIPGFLLALGGIAAALIVFVGETVITIAAKLLEWAGAFVDWIVPMLPGLVTKLGEITDSIGGWITGTAVPWLKGAAAALGTAIMDGIKGAISAGAGAITDAIKGAVTAALNAAKAALGIKSPSTVFADEVGAPIVEGMAFGILKTMPNLLAAMRGSLDSTIQEIVGWVDDDATGTMNKVGADAINAFIAGMRGQAGGASTALADITDLLKTGIFKGGDGWQVDDPFIQFLLKARTDATALANVLDLLKTGDFKGGILGLTEDDPFILALLSAAEAAKKISGSHIGPANTGGSHIGPLKQALSGTSGAMKDILDLLKTGVFTGGDGWQADDPFIKFLLKARTDATALANVLKLLKTGDFSGGIFGLSEDDPFILALLSAASAAKDLDAGMSIAGPNIANDFALIGDAATATAAATVKATDDILDHIKLLGGKSLDALGYAGDKSGGMPGYSGGGGGMPGYSGGGDSGGMPGYSAGSDAGMGFGDGWKSGIEQIAPVIQDTTRMTFQQLHEVVLLPWQEDTRTFFGGAGFGFIGAASVGVMSAAGGFAQVAGAAGGAAGTALASGLQGSVPAATAAIGSIQAALNALQSKTITITIHTVHTDDGGGGGREGDGFLDGLRGIGAG